MAAGTVRATGAGPLISVVVPVHGVAGVPGPCLDSVLGQGGGVPLEVIAVDDASPDQCGEMLDERARSDGRLTVLHLTSAGGPGNAQERRARRRDRAVRLVRGRRRPAAAGSGRGGSGKDQDGQP